MKTFCKLLVLAVFTSIVMGCASSSKDLAASYVSPLQYSVYDCQQLAAETQRISVRFNQLAERIDTAAENDKKIAAGAIFFYPIFFLGGNKDRENEYSRLKGEYEAIHQAAVQRKCSGVVNTIPAN